MFINKDDNASHTSDISEMMLDFISKEGSNSYPTVTVLLNRLLLSIDDYEWKKNSEISDALPELKIHDDVHWYKLKDMYSNLRNAILNNSILSNSTIFINENSFTLKNISNIFKTDNAVYILDENNRLNKVDDTFNNIIKTYKNTSSTSDNYDIVNVKDMFSYGAFDFVLCDHDIYRLSNDGSVKLVYNYPTHTLNAFALVSDEIVVASNHDGGLIFNNITTTFNLRVTVKYKTGTIIQTTTDPNNPNNSGSSSSDPGSSGSSSTTTIITNKLPEDNNCTFVYPKGGDEFDLGNSTTSGSFSLTDNFNSVTVDKPIGILPLDSNRHYNNKCFIALQSDVEFDKIKYNITNVTYAAYTEKLIYFITSDNYLHVFVKGEADSFIKFNSSNGISNNPNYIFIKNDDVYLYTANGWLRSINSSDDIEPTFAFLLFDFNWERDNEKDKINIQYSRMSVNALLSSVVDKINYDKYLGKVNNANTTFMIAFSKNKISGKTVFNLFGTDDRRKKAEEMKICCNAFDIGD